ncbi:MAG: hypothetical protein J6P73_08540 [Bacteroidales bacterium]|nr:hypothetical protein [Bacteroidales bacterium]
MDRKHHLRKVRNKTSRKLDSVLLSVILVTAFALRVWQNDFWMNLPFALLNTGSVGLVYLIGKRWHNSKTGLLSAAFFAVSQLTMFMDQTPWFYSIGLFVLLLLTLLGNRFLMLYQTPKPAFYFIFLITIALQFAVFRLDGFFIEQLRYSMYDSYLFMFATALLAVMPFILGRWNKKIGVLGIASILCFLGAPQFGFPFFIITLFSFHKNSTMNKAQTIIAVVGLLFIGICALLL